MSKTTKKHFLIFKKEVEKWLEAFSLNEWRIAIIHEDTADLPNCRAWTQADVEKFAGTISLGVDWGVEKPVAWVLKSCAFHEVMHILLWTLSDLNAQRHAPAGLFEWEEHRAIYRLEKFFFGRE
jgi:hypothetical protein